MFIGTAASQTDAPRASIPTPERSLGSVMKTTDIRKSRRQHKPHRRAQMSNTPDAVRTFTLVFSGMILGPAIFASFASHSPKDSRSRKGRHEAKPGNSRAPGQGKSAIGQRRLPARVGQRLLQSPTAARQSRLSGSSSVLERSNAHKDAPSKLFDCTPYNDYHRLTAEETLTIAVGHRPLHSQEHRQGARKDGIQSLSQRHSVGAARGIGDISSLRAQDVARSVYHCA
jgi:hypothetical protein